MSEVREVPPAGGQSNRSAAMLGAGRLCGCLGIALWLYAVILAGGYRFSGTVDPYARLAWRDASSMAGSALKHLDGWLEIGRSIRWIHVLGVIVFVAASTRRSRQWMQWRVVSIIFWTFVTACVAWGALWWGAGPDLFGLRGRLDGDMILDQEAADVGLGLMGIGSAVGVAARRRRSEESR